MKILMTQRELIHRAGTELFIIEVAKELRKRGHEVAIFSPRVGDITRTLLNAGVWVETKLADLPWVPDVIHGQHHLQTMAALAYFENVPALHHCHGVTPWIEQPPLHPRIHVYVVMCEWMEPRMGTEFGIPADRVCTVANFVNTSRFSRVRTPPERPVRALLFGNSRLPGNELAQLEKACQAEGLTLDKIGSEYGTAQLRPEMFLLDYDLVFAIGKCAIEALACGCAVIPIMPGQAGHLITPANYQEWAFSNFSPRLYLSADEVNPGWLQLELRNYSPAAVTQTSEILRREQSLQKAVDRLEALYQKIILDTAENPTGPHPRELVSYLEKLSAEVEGLMVPAIDIAHLQLRCQQLEEKKHSLQKKIQELQSRNEALQKKNILLRTTADTYKQRWNQTAAHLRKHIIGRWFLRQIRRLPGKNTPT